MHKLGLKVALGEFFLILVARDLVLGKLSEGELDLLGNKMKKGRKLLQLEQTLDYFTQLFGVDSLPKVDVLKPAHQQLALVKSGERGNRLLLLQNVDFQHNVFQTKSLQLNALLYFLLDQSEFFEVLDVDLLHLIVLQTQYESIEFDQGEFLSVVAGEDPLEEVACEEVEVLGVFQLVVLVESLREEVQILDHEFHPVFLPLVVLEPNIEGLLVSGNFKPYFPGSEQSVLLLDFQTQFVEDSVVVSVLDFDSEMAVESQLPREEIACLGKRPLILNLF